MTDVLEAHDLSISTVDGRELANCPRLTAGKGGIVSHVVGAMTPGGDHYAAFKKPTAEELAHMHTKLAGVVTEHFTFEHYVDDNMRNIPDHYHAHARPKGGFFGHGLRRRAR